MRKRLKLVTLAILILTFMVFPKIEVYGATDLVVNGVKIISEPIYQGDSFTLTFKLKNISSKEIKNIAMRIEKSDFSFNEGGSIQQIKSSLAAGEEYTISPAFTIKYNGNSSNQIPITFLYEKDGIADIQEHEDYITVKTANDSDDDDDGGSRPPTDTSKYKPNLMLNSSSIPTVTAGTHNNLSLVFKNSTNYKATHVSIAPNASLLQDGKIKINQQYLEPTDATIIANKTQAFTLNLLIDEDIDPGVYPVPLNISYSNSYNDSYNQEMTTYIKVVKDNNLNALVSVTEQKMSNSSPKIGDPLTLDFTIKNAEKYPIKNFEIWIEGLSDEAFALKNSSTKQTVSRIGSTMSNKFTFSYQILDQAVSKSYPYKLFFQYTNSSGYTVKRSLDYNIYVSSKDLISSSGSVEAKDFIHPTKVLQDQPFDVSFNVTNKGTITIKNVKVILEDNEIFLPQTPNVLSLNSMAVGESQPVKFTIVGTGKEIKSRSYPISFSLTYDIEEKGEVTTLTTKQNIGVYLEAEEEGSAESSVPKIIVSRYATDPLIINAGSEFDLSLSFMNTNKLKTISNVKAFITIKEIGEETKGNVFTPVNSSNTFYIDQIPPRGTVDRNIRLYTVPDANPKTYTVDIIFEYEDLKGNPYEATEIVGINVKQPTKVETSDLQLPMEAYAGQPVPIYFDIYNTGKVKVYNLMVKAEGNFTADPQSYYIGNFDSGLQDYYEGSIFPMEPGILEGKFIISYDDSSGEHIEILKEISLNVMEAMPMEPFPGEYPMEPLPEENIGLGLGAWIGIAAAAIAIIAATVIILKKRRAKKEGLDVDED